MKSFKYKFPSDSCRLCGATMFTRISFSAEIVGIFSCSKQFQCGIIVESTVRELELYMIATVLYIHPRISRKTKNECLPTL